MPYPSKGKSAFTRDKTLDQKDYSMAAMAALKAAVETCGFELELARVQGTEATEPVDSPVDRVLELHEIYFQLLINKVPGDVPAAFPGSTPAPEKPVSPTVSVETSGSAAGDLVITFSKKHPNKTIAEIDLVDPNYVRWLADKAQDVGVQKTARAYLDAKYEADDKEDPFAA